MASAYSNRKADMLLIGVILGRTRESSICIANNMIPDGDNCVNRPASIRKPLNCRFKKIMNWPKCGRMPGAVWIRTVIAFDLVGF
jgi:hypothetical protein